MLVVFRTFRAEQMRSPRVFDEIVTGCAHEPPPLAETRPSASAGHVRDVPSRLEGIALRTRTVPRSLVPTPETPAESTRSGGRDAETSRPGAFPMSRCTLDSVSSAPLSWVGQTRTARAQTPTAGADRGVR